MKEKFSDVLKRLAKHTCFSLFGTATDTLVLWIFSHFILEGMGYVGICIISPVISFECGNMVNFLMSSCLVWKDRMAGKPARSYWKYILAFNLSYTSVFFLKTALLLGIQALTKWDVVWCNIIALTLAGMLNFVLNEKVIFRKKR